MLEGFQAGLAWIVILRKREAFRKPSRTSIPPRSRASPSPTSPACFRTPASSAPAPRSKPPSRARASTSPCKPPAKTFQHGLGPCFSKSCRWQANEQHGTSRANARLRGNLQSLKKRGFKFVGPVIVYAWMQAVGMVNDHAPTASAAAPSRLRVKVQNPPAHHEV